MKGLPIIPQSQIYLPVEFGTIPAVSNIYWGEKNKSITNKVRKNHSKEQEEMYVISERIY